MNYNLIVGHKTQSIGKKRVFRLKDLNRSLYADDKSRSRQV